MAQLRNQRRDRSELTVQNVFALCFRRCKTVARERHHRVPATSKMTFLTGLTRLHEHRLPSGGTSGLSGQISPGQAGWCLQPVVLSFCGGHLDGAVASIAEVVLLRLICWGSLMGQHDSAIVTSVLPHIYRRVGRVGIAVVVAGASIVGPGADVRTTSGGRVCSGVSDETADGGCRNSESDGDETEFDERFHDLILRTRRFIRVGGFRLRFGWYTRTAFTTVIATHPGLLTTFFRLSNLAQPAVGESKWG